jgi:hypothetical protein
VASPHEIWFWIVSFLLTPTERSGGAFFGPASRQCQFDSMVIFDRSRAAGLPLSAKSMQWPRGSRARSFGRN